MVQRYCRWRVVQCEARLHTAPLILELVSREPGVGGGLASYAALGELCSTWRAMQHLASCAVPGELCSTWRGKYYMM